MTKEFAAVIGMPPDGCNSDAGRNMTDNRDSGRELVEHSVNNYIAVVKLRR